MSKSLDILKQYWGHNAFRPLQEEIVNSVLDNKDTLALLPTGGGKSICFQIPALVREGLCLVVSPLIALMKDQVQNLVQRNISAAAIFSGLHYKDIDRILDNAVSGYYKFLYVSPERLSTELFLARFQKMPINLIAVDEAHCISQWGYDFRPSYRQIASLRNVHPKVPILALTATATPEVVEDIQAQLLFKQKNVLQKSFQRNNLAYIVRLEEGKLSKAIDILQKIQGSSVVYVRNRKKTKEIALWFCQNGISADFYHAGLDFAQRSAKQDAWIQNRIRVMVATNAFGMGIDKPDVRTVIHFDLPDNLEAYFQEAGRAGRDGKKAFAVLLYNAQDKISLQAQYEAAFPNMDEIRRVYQALGSYFQQAVGSHTTDSFDFDIGEFVENYKLDINKTMYCLKTLEETNCLSLSDALFTQSTIQFIASKEKLYDYRLKNADMDKLLDMLLRQYQGIFANSVAIKSEKQLATALQIDEKALHQILHTLHRDKMIDFRPAKSKPQITFLQERVAVENLQIDQALFDFRKKRHGERLEKTISYAEQSRCRSQMLLAYFGEKNVPFCEICDVCLNRKKLGLDADEHKRYTEKIKMLLQREPLPLEHVVDSFSSKRTEKILQVIVYLESEGVLIRDKFGYLVWAAK